MKMVSAKNRSPGMLGGEEQYVFGLVDHDGVPGFKWKEFVNISKRQLIFHKTCRRELYSANQVFIIKFHLCRNSY